MMKLQESSSAQLSKLKCDSPDFSEKLIDAILCETVPIYWGCPNIGDFFDTRAMILCESLEDLQKALTAMSETDYEERRDALLKLGPLAETYADIHRRAVIAIKSCELEAEAGSFKA